jgi:hypothetical protein
LNRCIALVCALAATSCHDRPAPAAAASAKPSADPTTAPVTAASTPARTTEAWYAGTWSGTYTAVAHRLDLSTKLGGLAEWTVDDGRNGVGPGTLTLTPAADGVVTGTTAGALGKGELRGAFDGDALALRLVPEDGAGFSGVVVAHREGDEVVGALHAATSDGHVARDAQITLQRAK